MRAPLFAVITLLTALLPPTSAQQSGSLPKSTVWNFPQDIVEEQHQELMRYFEARIGEAARNRSRFWTGDWDQVVTRNRTELRKLIGAVDAFMPPAPSVRKIAETPAFTFSVVEWPILRLGTIGATAGSSGSVVREYGLLLESKRPGKHPGMVAIPDATLSAADIAGLSQRLPQREQYARSLAVNGYVVFVPFFTQRRTFSQPWTEDRDWLVRLGYQTGRHLIGAEVQQVSAAIDFLSTRPGVDSERIGVAGAGQGGLTALYAAALDTRIKATLVAHYFNRREQVYNEPEDRAIWKQMERFGDAEIAAMVAPRALVIDRGGADVKAEFTRAKSYFEDRKASMALRFSGERDQETGPSTAAIEAFDSFLHPDIHWMISPPQPPADPEPFYAIANAQFSQWQARFRNLALEAYAARDSRPQPDTSSIENYKRSVAGRRELFREFIGRYPKPEGPLEAKSVQVYDAAEFRGYRLSVGLYEGVHAYGILLVPKDIKPGERRPVVVTQHGFSGTPEDALGVIDNPRADTVYSKFGRDLARRGYVVFAPLISAPTTAKRNALVRRAHLTGLAPIGIEIQKISRVLDYLETLPFVDKERFGFYGLSYGGYMALWTGPIESRYKVIIASGFFNDWNLKSTDVTEGTSFIFYKDTFDMTNFGFLNQFNHSDLAALAAPAAYMVEIGSKDGIVMEPRRFVDIELNRVLDLYRRLGIPERARIARFEGPHKIDGTEAYPFLDQMLGWTPRR